MRAPSGTHLVRSALRHPSSRGAYGRPWRGPFLLVAGAASSLCSVPVLPEVLGRRGHTTLAKTTRLGGKPSWAESPVLEFGANFKGENKCPQGLRYCPDFITEEEEAEILQVLDGPDAAWRRHIRRAQQFFGVVYYQTSHEVPALQPVGNDDPQVQVGRSLDDLPTWLVERVLDTGAFASGSLNQVLGNEYLQESGIGLHVEDPAAGDAFVTLSLISPVQFTLQRAIDGKPQHKESRDKLDCVKVLLEPRSLLLLQGESRHDYAHAIRQSKLVNLRGGEVLRRGKDYRRVSLTFRDIATAKRTSARQDMPQSYNAYTVQHKGSMTPDNLTDSAQSPV